MAAHPHLRLEREEPIRDKKSGGYPRIAVPSDIPGHARKLQASMRTAIDQTKQNIGGYDERLLFKLQLGGLSPEQLEQRFRGVEVVSQEEGGVGLVFANERALRDFEARLTTLSTGGSPKYKEVLYALGEFESFSPDDRMGWALKRDGFPKADSFVLDIELWPLGWDTERKKLTECFLAALRERKIEILDSLVSPGYIAVRVRVSQDDTEWLLHHRDIRTVDLPPANSLEQGVYKIDIQDIPEVPSPPSGAPILGILDSGVATGHPLLKSAIGDAQGFMRPERKAEDDSGHGTLVAGIALYDDVAEAASSKTFIPQFFIVSGRVLDDRAEVNPRFIENLIDEAVRHFKDTYGCRLFCLCYGDKNKPFSGGRVRGLAYTLDRLSRELDVLFVVPTGNISIDELSAGDAYPEYLLSGRFPMLDPAPAYNSITVGSVARYDLDSAGVRYPKDVPHTPIARTNQPSPFTRAGLSVKGAIKPDFVHYGGNFAFDNRMNRVVCQGLGELSTSRRFAEGSLLEQEIGTSFAAPHVAHFATRVLAEYPKATPNLVRSLLAANARVPGECREVLTAEGDTQSKLESKASRLVGYGIINAEGLFKSLEDDVTLLAEDVIPNKSNHFYEIPIPDSLYRVGKTTRTREVTVSLAYCPQVRTTRIEYKASRVYFRLVEATSLEEAVLAYSKPMEGEDEQDGISELGTNRREYGATRRSTGTLQASTWIIKRPRSKRLFVVVTRNDFAWGEPLSSQNEPYSLVVKIADRENSEANMYTEIRALLQARQRERARARVGR